MSGFLSWLRPDRSVGGRGERAAAAFLRRNRYRVLARNLRNRFGEIDLLAEAPDGRTVVVVEVKAAEVGGDSRGGADNPPPEVHVNRRKQQKIVALAAQMARRWKLTDRPIRFDVIGVDLPQRGKPVVRHHPAAFESHV